MAKVVRKKVMKIKRKEKLSKNEIAEAKPTKANYLQIYDDQLPNIVSTNVKLQAKALGLLEQKLDQATPQQLAVIYGILSDKTEKIIGSRGGGKVENTYNMYMGGSYNPAEMFDVMSKVVNRMSSNVIEVDAEVKNDEQDQDN